MPTTDERLAYLEGRVNEHSQTFAVMRDSIGLLRDSVTSLEHRVDRFERRVDARFDAMDRKFEGKFEAMDHKLDLVQDKMLTRLGWVIGLFITSTIAIISTILTRG